MLRLSSCEILSQGEPILVFFTDHYFDMTYIVICDALNPNLVLDNVCIHIFNIVGDYWKWVNKIHENTYWDMPLIFELLQKKKTISQILPLSFLQITRVLVSVSIKMSANNTIFLLITNISHCYYICQNCWLAYQISVIKVTRIKNITIALLTRILFINKVKNYGLITFFWNLLC